MEVNFEDEGQNNQPNNEADENILEIKDDQLEDHIVTQLDKIIVANTIPKEEEDDNLQDGGKEDEEESKENRNNSESKQKESHKKEKPGFMRLPMSKVKNIMKLDGDIKLCQKNAYFVIGRLTELFLQELSADASSVTKLNKRKTMNLEDISCALKSLEKYNFIDVNSIFTVETIEDLKKKEEKFEKKVKQAELKSEKKETKIEKVNKKTKIPTGNMRIDQMFGNN